jgi:hypothetical protein
LRWASPVIAVMWWMPLSFMRVARLLEDAG